MNESIWLDKKVVPAKSFPKLANAATRLKTEALKRYKIRYADFLDIKDESTSRKVDVSYLERRKSCPSLINITTSSNSNSSNSSAPQSKSKAKKLLNRRVTENFLFAAASFVSPIKQTELTGVGNGNSRQDSKFLAELNRISEEAKIEIEQDINASTNNNEASNSINGNSFLDVDSAQVNAEKGTSFVRLAKSANAASETRGSKRDEEGFETGAAEEEEFRPRSADLPFQSDGVIFSYMYMLQSFTRKVAAESQHHDKSSSAGIKLYGALSPDASDSEDDHPTQSTATAAAKAMAVAAAAKKIKQAPSSDFALSRKSFVANKTKATIATIKANASASRTSTAPNRTTAGTAAARHQPSPNNQRVLTKPDRRRVLRTGLLIPVHRTFRCVPSLTFSRCISRLLYLICSATHRCLRQ